jgi:hypothetical protein
LVGNYTVLFSEAVFGVQRELLDGFREFEKEGERSAKKYEK